MKKFNLFLLLLLLFFSLNSQVSIKPDIKDEKDKNISHAIGDVPNDSDLVSIDKNKNPVMNDSVSNKTEVSEEDAKDKIDLDDDKNLEHDIQDDSSKAGILDFPSEKIGIQGNWVKKREWVKESYRINNKIQNIVIEIEKLKSPFDEKYIEINGVLDVFYIKEGLKQEEVSSLFNSINKYLDKKRKKKANKIKEGVTSEAEVQLDLAINDLKILKKEVEQLRLDIKSIDNLKISLKDRIKKVDEYIKMALDESKKSRDLANETWYIIDDLKARDIFYQLKSDSLAKVKAIKKYLTGAFNNDFKNVFNLIKSQMEKSKLQIKDLEDRGIVIKNRSLRLKDIKNNKLQKEKKIISNREHTDIDYKSMPLGQKVYNFIVNALAKVYSFVSDF